MHNTTKHAVTHATAAENARLRDEHPKVFNEVVEDFRAAIAREGWSRPRRYSSIAALLVGDVKALLEKDAESRTRTRVAR
jgi:hypothetical protein